jgi:hypothetical protein
MRIRRLLTAALLCLSPQSTLGAERCLAIDGDTLVCNRQKVRLTNVYAAELNEPGGRAAKRRLQLLISGGEVTLKPLGHDRYGRTLAEVYVNGRRIEQDDVGSRAGRGTQWGVDRHDRHPGGSRLPIKRQRATRGSLPPGSAVPVYRRIGPATKP